MERDAAATDTDLEKEARTEGGGGAGGASGEEAEVSVVARGAEVRGGVVQIGRHGLMGV